MKWQAVVASAAVVCTNVAEVWAQDDVAPDASETVLEVLNADNLATTVFQSPRSWLVLVSASEGCPGCETYQELVESASRISKDIVRFGVIDIANQANSNELGLTGNEPMPQLRLYQEHGMPNAYRKGRYYREFSLYTGQPSARGIKKFIFDKAIISAPVTLISDEWEDWKSKENAVVAFSSKSEPSALIAALGRTLKSRAVVGQLSSFDVTAQADAAAAFGGVQHVPSLAVRGSEGSWSILDQESLSKASLDDLISFVGESIDLGDLSKVVPGAGQGDSEEAPGSGATPPPKAHGLISKMSAFESQVQQTEMPVIVAVRLKGDNLEPTDWKKFVEKAHGVSSHIVYCDSSDVEDALKSHLCPKVSSSSEDWAFLLYEYEANFDPNEKRTRAEPRIMDSLGKARSDALASIPETVVRLNAEVVNGFLQAAVQSKMVPVVLFGKTPDPPSMLIATAAASQGLAMIGYWPGSTPQDRELLGVPPAMSQLPLYIGIIVQAGDKPEEAQMMLSMYDKMRFGKFSYASMLSFILQTSMSADEDQARDWVEKRGAAIGIALSPEEPSQEGSRVSDKEAEIPTQYDDAATILSKVETIEEWEELCPNDPKSANLLCVVALLDGDPLNAGLEQQLALFQSVRETVLKLPTPKSRLRFMWVDATCQEAFTRSVDIELSALPAVVVTFPKKQVSFKMLSGFEEDKIEKFLVSVASGIGKAGKTYQNVFPKISNIDCSALPSREIIEVEDDDDEDWLAEIQAEEAREEAARKEAMQRELEELEKAKEEQAKADAAQKAKKKKKKKKKTKKTASPKDEL
mmetsp:Transcript_8236/g.15136  ORF Transcript_8236/g.15136 Transcript_8236/m.15136 type:complete len:807 (+) Transcript_8236:221-2641(+)